MTFKSEAFDVSVTVPCNSPAPPSYDAISTSTVSADSIWSKLCRWIFPRASLQSKQECLSCIRAIVSSPDYSPSFVAQTASACVATLPAAEFSKLLQQPNIEDHTAPYWAIVNNRLEALWAFMDFIPDPSPACYSDLRLACMMVGDNTLFTQLDLREIVSSKDDSLRQFLGCTPDEVQIQESSGRFVASFCFRMFQKRLRTAQAIAVEYLARGRMWTLWFYLCSDGKWVVDCRLEEPSLPVEGSNQLRIEAHRKSPDCATPEPLIITTEFSLAPESGSCIPRPLIYYRLGDWPMDNDTVYVDCEGTLHMSLTITVK
ncbi:uncharacterized protein HD556DRAFT_330818 [Suillus plorans]|uniref:Uncharacterized protein n=1 Tax=Suillus plorans TaxID=116603 RepID=A0A9P7J7M2_9AGAM|nr:uncharacterized protein HD556DRAFT_330818 [Suillus plorans]KAG1806676.1 hypothetical protein HD556DRAFT_330818 [Suillus plorans]